MDLRLTTRNPVTGEVRLKIPEGRAPAVSGLEQLAQQFVFLVLKPTGSDVMAPQLGGDLRAMIGSEIEGESRSLALNSVILAQSQMKTAQINAKNRRSAAEMIRNANLVSVDIIEGANIAASVVTELYSAGAGLVTAAVPVFG